MRCRKTLPSCRRKCRTEVSAVWSAPDRARPSDSTTSLSASCIARCANARNPDDARSFAAWIRRLYSVSGIQVILEGCDPYILCANPSIAVAPKVKNNARTTVVFCIWAKLNAKWDDLPRWHHRLIRAPADPGGAVPDSTTPPRRDRAYRGSVSQSRYGATPSSGCRQRRACA